MRGSRKLRHGVCVLGRGDDLKTVLAIKVQRGSFAPQRGFVPEFPRKPIAVFYFPVEGGDSNRKHFEPVSSL